MGNGDLNSMSAAVKVVIDNYPLGHKFFGNELKDDVVRIYPDAVNMYPDTILKMARRHRRDSYISIDHNNSLYQRVESNFEKERRIIREKEEAEKQTIKADSRQLDLPLFAYVFLVVFLLGFFVAPLPDVFALGCPLIPPSFMASRSVFGLTDPVFFIPASLIASRSDSKYIPATPMRLWGAMPFRCSRFLTPSEEMPKIPAISTTVYSFIYPIIPAHSSIYQVKNVMFSRIRDSRKGKTPKVGQNDTLYWVKMSHYRDIGTEKKIKNFHENLDYPHRFGILYICTAIGTAGQLNKRRTEAPAAESPIEGEGEYYEKRRTEKFSGLA